MINWVLNIIKRETENKLYGSVTFTFQNGKVTHAKTETSEKPPIDLINKE